MVDLVTQVDLVDAAVGEFNLVDVIGDESGAKAFGLITEAGHHFRTHDPLGEARVVLDVGGVLKLPAPLETLENERVQLGPGRVESGRVASRPAADDDHVLDFGFAHSRYLFSVFHLYFTF